MLQAHKYLCRLIHLKTEDQQHLKYADLSIDVGLHCINAYHSNIGHKKYYLINKQWYHCRGGQIKGSLGINFFPDITLWPFSYMVVHDLICDKDFLLRKCSGQPENIESVI